MGHRWSTDSSDKSRMCSQSLGWRIRRRSSWRRLGGLHRYDVWTNGWMAQDLARTWETYSLWNCLWCSLENGNAFDHIVVWWYLMIFDRLLFSFGKGVAFSMFLETLKWWLSGDTGNRDWLPRHDSVQVWGTFKSHSTDPRKWKLHFNPEIEPVWILIRLMPG